MAIFTKKLKRKVDGVLMIGTYVPEKSASILSLYCLAHGKTKTSVVKNLLNSWMEVNKGNLNENELVKLVAKRAYEKWESIIEKRKSWKSFETDLKKELQKNHLENYTNSIITLLYEKKGEIQK